MILQMLKFGNILNSRPAGREAVLRAKQIMNGSTDPDIILDFLGVEVLTPSFADEFTKGLKEIYPNKTIKFQGFEKNNVISDTLTALHLL